jgi:hypothetical protein
VLASPYPETECRVGGTADDVFIPINSPVPSPPRHWSLSRHRRRCDTWAELSPTHRTLLYSVGTCRFNSCHPSRNVNAILRRTVAIRITHSRHQICDEPQACVIHGILIRHRHTGTDIILSLLFHYHTQPKSLRDGNTVKQYYYYRQTIKQYYLYEYLYILNITIIFKYLIII